MRQIDAAQVDADREHRAHVQQIDDAPFRRSAALLKGNVDARYLPAVIVEADQTPLECDRRFPLSLEAERRAERHFVEIHPDELDARRFERPRSADAAWQRRELEHPVVARAAERAGPLRVRRVRAVVTIAQKCPRNGVVAEQRRRLDRVFVEAVAQDVEHVGLVVPLERAARRRADCRRKQRLAESAAVLRTARELQEIE